MEFSWKLPGNLLENPYYQDPRKMGSDPWLTILLLPGLWACNIVLCREISGKIPQISGNVQDISENFHTTFPGNFREVSETLPVNLLIVYGEIRKNPQTSAKIRKIPGNFQDKSGKSGKSYFSMGFLGFPIKFPIKFL